MIQPDIPEFLRKREIPTSPGNVNSATPAIRRQTVNLRRL